MAGAQVPESTQHAHLDGGLAVAAALGDLLIREPLDHPKHDAIPGPHVEGREGLGQRPPKKRIARDRCRRRTERVRLVGVVTTDAEGKFAFAEIPVDMRAMFFVSHGDFSTVGFGATNAEDEQAGVIEGGLKFQRGDVKIKLRKTYPVPVEVKVGDSDKPAVGAMVVGIEIAAAGDQSTALNAGETDKNGRVTLKLPAGKFMLRPGYAGLPVADYPATDIVVDKAKREQPIILRVNN